MAQTSWKITNGPSKFDLMVSLFDGSNEKRREMIFYGDKDNGPVAVAIDSLSREDGSGENWNFEGHFRGDTECYDYKGFYSTKTRKGALTAIN